jgi:hypothetical protein
MAVLPNVSFSVQLNTSSTPKLILTDTSTHGVDRRAIFTIQQPDGYVRTGNWATPDLTAGVYVFEIPLRLDSSGGFQCGSYNIQMENSANNYDPTYFTRSFNLVFNNPSLVIKNNFDVFKPNLNVSDTTSYSVTSFTTGTITRSWSGVSTPTGTITGTSQTFSLAYNGNFYDATYAISLTSTVTYTSTTYSWLTVVQKQTKSTSICAMTPPTISQMIYLIDGLRDTSCSGNDAKFTQAQALYTHIVDKIRNNNTTDIYVDIAQLLSLFNMSCTNSGAIIPAYVLPETGGSSNLNIYSILVGNGTSLDYTITHNLGSTNIQVQVYKVSTGELIICDVVVLTLNTVKISFYAAPAFNAYNVVIVGGASGNFNTKTSVDGGGASAVYSPSQIINGGGA